LFIVNSHETECQKSLFHIRLRHLVSKHANVTIVWQLTLRYSSWD